MRPSPRTIVLLFCFPLISGYNWGFYAHERINRLAVFTLPPEMIVFYKKHIGYIEQSSVNPDRRRFAVVDEAPRHYIDLDHFGDSALYTMPRNWAQAVEKYGEDTLKAYGVLPWHIQRMYFRLRDAFMVKDPRAILKNSAEIAHYIADAHVPLHTTKNYNGQLTGQTGIHALWESRLPELFSEEYDFFVGKAFYIADTQEAAWKAIADSHRAVDSVLTIERELSRRFGARRKSFETKGKQTMKVYSREYAAAYHKKLSGMVERRMRACILVVGSFWYTAWVDAGQPNLRALIDYTPSDEELQQRRRELEEWKVQRVKAREH